MKARYPEQWGGPTGVPTYSTVSSLWFILPQVFIPTTIKRQVYLEGQVDTASEVGQDGDGREGD